MLTVHLIPYLIIGYDILIKAAKNIFHGQIFDENFLMVIATIGAFILKEYPEEMLGSSKKMRTLVKILDNKASISFVAKGQDTYRGEMRIYLDTPCDIRDDGSSLTFSFEAHDNDRFCFYIYMEDDLFVKDPAGANDIVEEIINRV